MLDFIRLLAAKEFFRLPCLDGGWADIRQSNTNLLTDALLVQRQLSRHSSRRKVSDLALQFEVGTTAPRSRYRYANFREDFLVLQCRANKDTKKSSIGITLSPFGPVAMTCAPRATMVAG